MRFSSLTLLLRGKQPLSSRESVGKVRGIRTSALLRRELKCHRHGGASPEAQGLGVFWGSLFGFRFFY